MALVFVLALAVLRPVGDVVALPARDDHGDGELVERARRGDEWAHEAIYRRYVRLVASVAQRLLRDPAEVDDIVQETFLIAFVELEQLAEPGALRGWLARWTRLWSAREVEACFEQQASEEATQEQRAELALIDRALATMPQKLRTPWVLRHVLGHELADVATACSCSLATTKRRLTDADAIVARHVRGER